MNDKFLLFVLQTKRLKFWKHRHIRKLKKYLEMLYEPWNYPFAPAYMQIMELIELQKITCYICGYDVYNVWQLIKQLDKE